MRKIRNRAIKKRYLGLVILSLMLMVLSTQFSFVVGDTYQFNIDKATEQFRVEEYNKDEWKDIISEDTKPEEIFGGDAGKEEAESKYTVKATYESKWTLIDILSVTYLSDSILGALLLNFSVEDLDDEFDKNYAVHYALRGRWKYTTEEFKEESDIEFEKMPFFKNPKDLKDALDEYNELVSDLNNTYLFPLSADEFLYTLLISGIGILNPVHEYLEDLIEELDCKDVDVEGNSIIMERTGKGDYLVEITYTDQGIISSILFTDDAENVIYEVTGYNTRWIVSLIFGLMGAFVVAIAIITY